MEQSPAPDEKRDYVHWNRVYLAVILYTTIIISALWLFSRVYR